MKGQPLTPEQKDRMAEGRRRRAEARRAEKEADATATHYETESKVYVPLDEDLRQARRAKWLVGIPEDVAALISDDEIDKMEAKEQEEALADRKKKALDQVRLAMRHQARVDHELMDASTLRTAEQKRWLAERGIITINLPMNGSGNPAKGPNCFRVNGREFQNGHQYEVTRAEYQSLAYNHFGQWLHEYRFSMLNQGIDGESAKATLAKQIPDFKFAPVSR